MRLPSARAVRRVALALAVVAVAAVAGGYAVVAPWYRDVAATADAMVDAHLDHEVAHPGWSFPAHVWTASFPIDGAPPARIAFEAKARGYTEACPPASPGQYCAKTGDVRLRGGHFPEGDQPPGNDGWTRPLALEPLLVGVLVGDDGEVREHLPLDKAPKQLVAAILAAEDADFYSHSGVDVTGTLRAVFVDVRGGGYAQGASTLTMQVVRNLSQEKGKTLDRKLREMASAVAIDHHLGKDAILGVYLDAPYLGQDGNLSICGFEAASWYYYGKRAADLDLSEAATLAAILPAPGKFAPDRFPDRAKERRDRVLQAMAAQGWDVAAALAEPVQASPHHLPAERWPAYLQATRMALEERLPPEAVYGAGLDVFTALDPAIEDSSTALFAEREAYLERVTGRRGDGPLLAAGALVDPSTGALVAVVDPSVQVSTDFVHPTQARRQAGSSFKPMVYALGLSVLGPDGKPKWTASKTEPNAPRQFAGTNGWCPRNVGGRYSPTSCLAEGIAESQNIATASLLEDAGGPPALIALAQKVGYDTKEFPSEMGLALGQATVTPLEQARMVATIVGGGTKKEASPILLARDADGDDRVVLSAAGERVLTPETAALTREMMALVVQFGTGGSVHGGGGFPGYEGPIVGKTGTADDEKDLWFVGGTPDYVGALWLGYDQPARIGGSASDLAAPMFGWWMRAVHEGLPPRKFTDGPAIEHHWVCTQTGLVPGAGCKAIDAPYLPGTAPKQGCPGTHPPETGETMEEHQSLWEKLAAAAAAQQDTDTDAGGQQDTDAQPED